jgi:hypothetical protein
LGSNGRDNAGLEGDDIAKAIENSLETCENNFTEKQQAMEKVLTLLPEGKLVFDVPGNGYCGYYALQALHNTFYSQRKVVKVFMEDVTLGLKNMSAQIGRLVSELEQREADGDQIDENSPIAILRATLLEDGRYSEYIDVPGGFNWFQFRKDLEAGKIWFDYPFFPFAREAFNLPPDVECIDDANSNALRTIPSNGALVRIGGNHFVVVLSNGIEEVKSQDRIGQWWSSKPGEPAVSEED